ncbi:MAG TPA: 3-isopropylmalate dehydratase [Gemmatimonadaceae bacterium]|jgi:3-isopropylmalate/(R)-2-methylmalate dehydratase small subunit
MTIELSGRARVLGDDINTDYIIASTRKRDTLDEQILKRYLLETVDPAFAASVRPGDIIVAGSNFGCGSAMEIAVTVILAAGIKAVLARSFSRTFFRNAVNNGLLPIECNTTGIIEGDTLEISAGESGAAISDHQRGLRISARPLPPMMGEILEAGGLVEYVRRGHWSRGVAEAG